MHRHCADDYLEGLYNLGQAVNPKFTEQRCKELLDRMDSSQLGQVSVDDFLDLVSKFNGRSDSAIRAMHDAAERISRRENAGASQAEACVWASAWACV